MKRLFVLDGKDFQSGISMLGAHADRGGLFYKATGVTPLFGAGASIDPNNGLLMAGAAGTAVSETLGGNIINMIPADGIYYTTGILAAASDNKIYKLLVASTLPPDAAFAAEITSAGTLTGGMAVFNGQLYYHRTDYLGRSDGSTVNDTWQAVTADYWGAMHVHYGLNKLIFGNGFGKLGIVSSAHAVTLSALTFDGTSQCTALSDDGVYVIAAITRNTTANTDVLTDTRILFWDGSVTTGFVREYPITDPFIYALKKTPIGVFAFGVTGIWQVTFDGVKKVFSHSPGVFTASGASAIHYGKGAVSFFSNAVLWGGQVGSSTARALKSFGSLDSAALNAYLNPVNLTASVNITAINAQISKGWVYVADSTPAVIAYPIGSGTPQTGVSAQTVYLKTRPIELSHIDVVFGEPLASGDTLDLDIFRDEDTAVTSLGDISYTANRSIRRHSFKCSSPANKFQIHSQLALLTTFTAGAPKIQRIEGYGNFLDV